MAGLGLVVKKRGGWLRGDGESGDGQPGGLVPGGGDASGASCTIDDIGI